MGLTAYLTAAAIVLLLAAGYFIFLRFIASM